MHLIENGDCRIEAMWRRSSDKSEEGSISNIFCRVCLRVTPWQDVGTYKHLDA